MECSGLVQDGRPDVALPATGEGVLVVHWGLRELSLIRCLMRSYCVEIVEVVRWLGGVQNRWTTTPRESVVRSPADIVNY